jgi:hypothetical protein
MATRAIEQAIAPSVATFEGHSRFMEFLLQRIAFWLPWIVASDLFRATC